MRAGAYLSAAGALTPALKKRNPERSNKTTRSCSRADSQEGVGQSPISRSLALSQSRTYDSALAILRAYKLTGNFPAELEIVLRDLGVLDEVSCEIREPTSPLSDARLVVFRPNTNVDAERFEEITRLIDGRIGCRAMQPRWAGLFRY